MKQKHEKSFKYDTLIEPEDLCNRQEEKRLLLKRAKENRRTIVLAPRRYGKTSLIKNIIGASYHKQSRKHLVLAFDFMNVQSFRSIAERLQQGLTQEIATRFPLKNLAQEASRILRGLSLQVNLDPITGNPFLNLDLKQKDPGRHLTQLFSAIKRLANQYPCMLVLDEFHDISFIKEAEAYFRNLLQELNKSAVFILGSKLHLISRMFLDHRAPLYQYGDEFGLKPIHLKDWIPYFEERLKPHGLKIEDQALDWLMTELFNVPNSICEIGAWLVDHLKPGTKVDIKLAKEELDTLVDQKQTYAYLLQGYSEKEIRILKGLAIKKYATSMLSVDFLSQVGLPKSSVDHNYKKMTDLGLIEHEIDKGYRVSDPMLAHYLRTH